MSHGTSIDERRRQSVTTRHRSPQHDPAAGLGPRIRALRTERGMTLKQLGARAALSHPFLSQVERGLAVPSIGALQRIASALQVPTGHLWSSGRRKHFVQSTAREDAPVLPAYDGSNAGEVRVLMAADQPMHVLEATGLSTAFAPRTMVNEGDVVVYVVSGAIEVDLDGTTYELAAGGAIEFSGVLPSNLRRTGPPDTRVLFVRTQPQDV